MNGPKKYPSNLHALLGKTDAELRAEAEAEGVDPDQAAQDMRNRALAAAKAAKRQHPPNPEREDEDSSSEEYATMPVFRGPIDADAAPPFDSAGEHSTLVEILGLDSNGHMFITFAKDDSMRGAGIIEGDWIVVDTSKQPVDGSIILVDIPGFGQALKMLVIEGVLQRTLRPDMDYLIINKSSPPVIAIGVVVARAGLLT